jgi:hypothetical protein
MSSIIESGCRFSSTIENSCSGPRTSSALYVRDQPLDMNGLSVKKIRLSWRRLLVG